MTYQHRGGEITKDGEDIRTDADNWQHIRRLFIQGSDPDHPHFPESANDRQVGGEHYRNVSIQHWDIVVMHNLDYFQGQITKYVMRWRRKGGVEDLKKARHFLDKYIEVEEKRAHPLMSTDGQPINEGWDRGHRAIGSDDPVDGSHTP